MLFAGSNTTAGKGYCQLQSSSSAGNLLGVFPAFPAPPGLEVPPGLGLASTKELSKAELNRNLFEVSTPSFLAARKKVLANRK